jgi:hypothetical protein
MASLLCFGAALAAGMACIIVGRRWFSEKEADVRSDVTKLVISADRRRQRRQSMERVVRDSAEAR